MLLRSPNDIRRAAQRLVEQHEAAQGGRVATLWQRSTDTNAAFAERVQTARERLHPNQLLIAVCAFDALPCINAQQRGVCIDALPYSRVKQRGICIVELPPCMLTLFDGPARYRVCYGGRGAGRSWSFARALIVRSLMSRIRILCAREFQNSLAESVLSLISDQIELLGLAAFFEVQAAAIYSRNGSEFIFSGIRSNPTRIKSLEGASIAFVEEAEGITNTSWEILIPTIRAAGSEIWCAFNPDQPDDPTFERFVTHPPDNAIVLKTTFADNGKFPAPLREEMEYLRRVDDDAFRHVWLGECRQHSAAQIFRGKYATESFEPQAGWDGPYFGADWGFANDPTTCVKLWVNGTRLYIEHEAYQIGCDIDRTPALFDLVPGARSHTIRGDSARPETISYLQSHGYPQIVAAAKGPNSVEDGIQFLRSFEMIVCHPRCVHALDELRLYSFKQDRLSGDILPEPVDRHNHIIDASRYALEPLIQGGRGPAALLAYYAQQLAAQKTPQPQAVQQLPDVAKTRGAVITPLSGGP